MSLHDSVVFSPVLKSLGLWVINKVRAIHDVNRYLPLRQLARLERTQQLIHANEDRC